MLQAEVLEVAGVAAGALSSTVREERLAARAIPAALTSPGCPEKGDQATPMTPGCPRIRKGLSRDTVSTMSRLRTLERATGIEPA